jgi:hypothetical protein
MKVHMVVKDNNITASVGAGASNGLGGGAGNIPGTINPDGTFIIGVSRKLEGKFAGDTFTLALAGGCGVLTVSGKRTGD